MNWCELVQPAADEWIASRPQVVRDLIAKFPPNAIVRLGNTNGTVHSYSEDGTMTVNLTWGFNKDYWAGEALFFDRQVFGVKPEDLTIATDEEAIAGRKKP